MPLLTGFSGLYMPALVIVLAALLVLTPGCLQEKPATQSLSSPAAAPQVSAPVRAQYAPGEITALGAAAQERANESLNAISALPPGGRTFESTIVAFDTAMTDYTDAIYPMTLMGYVYPDPQVAAEGMALEASSAVFQNDVYTRRGLYNAMKGVTLRTPAESRLYNLTIRKFEKNGLNLPDDRLEKVRQMNDRLSGLTARYSANLNNDNTTLAFSESELAGVPESALATFKKTPGGYSVTMKNPDYVAVMKYAASSATRKAMYLAYFNRQAKENTALLEEAVAIRRNISAELGYPTWADYRIDGRMAENAANVMAFLDAIKEPLQEKTRAENAVLLSLKQELDPTATTLDPWDVAYLQNIHMIRTYSYDENEVKEYFPADNTVAGIFRIYGELFGIRVTEVTGADVWSPDVRLYRVTNETGGGTLGYLYLDLYPREGKYGHFATFTLISGRMKGGAWSVPVTAIVGNFPAPADNRPGLLTTYDVETLFHESGHAMHNLLTTVPYGTVSGFNAEWDFVETPSQTLQEWTYDPGILTALSGHYANTSQKIPPALRDRVIAARDVGAGYYYSTMLAKTLEDMEFHMADSTPDTRAVYARIYNEMTGLSLPEEIHQPASFSHLMGDYDAGYYGYLWSEVYALEIADTFRRDGMTNRTTGMRFRKEILAQGNIMDGGVLLKNFLGREPGNDAFYRRLGIGGVAGAGNNS